jgi:ssDNA-specific exonuclease RecJ
MNFSALKANDVLDLVEKLAIKNTSISSVQMLFCLIVFMELKFIEFDEILNSLVVLKAKKMELDSSKFYNTVE